MPSTKDIRRRIKSVKSTRQITRAMELVSAAKMRKAQLATLATRTYADLAWKLLQDLARRTGPARHPLLRANPETKKVGIVLLSSNRGLIGSFNENIVAAARKYAQTQSNPEFITMGKKGRDRIKKSGFTIAADFEKPDTSETVADITALAKFVTEEFLSGRYAGTVLIYMDFISTLRQQPHIRELLPLQTSRDETLGKVNMEAQPGDPISLSEHQSYLFEPKPETVLSRLIPRLVTMQIYQALLETNAAEHSARMVAMKNASDSAMDLAGELTLQYNQIRQAAITTEISEIVSGRLALTQS